MLVPADCLCLNIFMNKVFAIMNTEETSCLVIRYSFRVEFISPKFSYQKVRHLVKVSHLCSVYSHQKNLPNLEMNI